MTAVAFRLPPGILVWQAICEDCEGAFGVVAGMPPDGVYPRYCPFCAKRVTYRTAYHEEVPA